MPHASPPLMRLIMLTSSTTTSTQFLILDTCPQLPLLFSVNILEITLEPSEVYKVLYNLNPNKASGADKITTRVFKECASSITPSLTHLCNKSLNTAKLPTEWKISDVIPLHKRGDKSYLENYRPISLLCVVSKVSSTAFTTI